MSDEDLLTRWEQSGYPREIGERLLLKYSEPHRHYHTTEHLRFMFALLDSASVCDEWSAAEQQALELALWYHDREYEPARHDNELRSTIQFLGDAQQMDVSPAVQARVVDMILLSRTHQPETDDKVARLFCDLDLAILGEPAPRYYQFTKQIRNEYCRISEFYYVRGRRRVLRSFLQRRQLFWFLRDREAQARWNLQQELSELRLPVQEGLRLGFALTYLAACLVFTIVIIPYVAVPLLGLLTVCAWSGRKQSEEIDRGLRDHTLARLASPRRRQLWEAFSDLFLDTQVDCGPIAVAVVASNYSREEAAQILFCEVGPVLWNNVWEWAAFDQDWLRTEIMLRHYRHPSAFETRTLRWLTTLRVGTQWDEIASLAADAVDRPW
jgi:predicted metal-dependent HD superfamily phosphohydrolase